VSRHRWFLPETPDVVGLLREQVEITISALDTLRSWAQGEPAGIDTIHAAEQRGEEAKRALFAALRAAFVTPLEPEDVFALSRGIDWILNYTRDLTTESQVMECPPDEVVAEMARLLAESMRAIDRALEALGTANETGATDAADAAIAAERQLERTYYDGMGVLLDHHGRAERIARRELYRRCARIGELVIDVADRAVYAVVKQS
jgi:uncharacterized protein Yka (UPF0111/DUF47 family)